MERTNMGVTLAHRPLSSPARITIAALLINTLAQFVGVAAELLQGEGLNVPHLIIGIALLVVAALATTGTRWSLVLSVVVVLVAHILLISRPTNYSALLDPAANVGHFVVLVVSLASALVAVVAGIAAAMQAQQVGAPRR